MAAEGPIGNYDINRFLPSMAIMQGNIPMPEKIYASAKYVTILAASAIKVYICVKESSFFNYFKWLALSSASSRSGLRALRVSLLHALNLFNITSLLRLQDRVFRIVEHMPQVPILDQDKIPSKSGRSLLSHSLGQEPTC
jgi:hypothetical protein